MVGPDADSESGAGKRAMACDLPLWKIYYLDITQLRGDRAIVP